MKLKSLLMASALTVAFSWAAFAQVTPTPITGNPAISNMDPNWKMFRMMGVGCNTGIPAQLLTSYTSGMIDGGHDGLGGDDLPIVARNFDSSTVTIIGSILVPANAVLMHPGPNNECAVLRYTAPIAGVYLVSAQYRGAYANNGVSSGDGVTGMVLKNGIQVGNTVNTATGVGSIEQQVTLCAGDKIDYAVHMKKNHRYDSTILAGQVAKIPGAPAPACGGITIPSSQNETVSPCCAPWAKSSILQAISMTGTTFGPNGGYHAVNSISTLALSSLQGYLNMIASSTGATQLQLKWEAADLGTASNANGTGPLTTSGTWPQVAGTSAFTVTIPMTGAATYSPSASAAWPLTASPNQPFKHLTWYVFKTTISHNGQNQSVYMTQNCKENVFLYRSQPLYKVKGYPNSGILSVEYQSVDANGRLIKAASFKQLIQAVQGSRQNSPD